MKDPAVDVHTTVRFDSQGTACDAWHFPGEGDTFATAAGRPVVVMAHGLAGTKDSGLEPFAQRLAAGLTARHEVHVVAPGRGLRRTRETVASGAAPGYSSWTNITGTVTSGICSTGRRL